MIRKRDDYGGIRPPYTRREFRNHQLPEGLEPDEGLFCMQGIARSLSDVT
jgi:hypothetical protein